jgi:hypothetical protein
MNLNLRWRLLVFTLFICGLYKSVFVIENKIGGEATLMSLRIHTNTKHMKNKMIIRRKKGKRKRTKKSVVAITFERKRKVINNPCLNWESLSVYGGNRKLKVLSIKFSS